MYLDEIDEVLHSTSGQMYLASHFWLSIKQNKQGKKKNNLTCSYFLPLMNAFIKVQ